MLLNRISLLFAAVIWLVGCTSDNGEEMDIDCNQSDLSLSIDEQLAPTCNDPGRIVLSATGGNIPYSFSIDGTNFQESGVFENVGVGEYTVIVQDANECQDTDQVTLISDAAIEVTAMPSGCGNDDGEIEVTARGGDGSYQYSLDGTDFQDSNLFTGLSTGEYSVTVIDGNECETTSAAVKIGASLSSDVMPIIESNCALSGCHLDNRNPILDSEESVIEHSGSIEAEISAGRMPPGNPLPDEEIALIVNWVDCGAEAN